MLSELARIYEAQGRYAELADVLLAWVAVNADESEFVAINLRLASLYETAAPRRRRHRPLPGDPHTRPRARRSARRAGPAALPPQNWQGLYETYEAEAAATDEPRQKAARLYKAAETLEERLCKVEDAIARYNLPAARRRASCPAQKALIRLYEKLGRWTDLVSCTSRTCCRPPTRSSRSPR